MTRRKRRKFPSTTTENGLKVSKTEIKAFIREFEKITKEYEGQVSSAVAAITVHPDLFSRMTILKNSI